jgi:hypothetical protein
VTGPSGLLVRARPLFALLRAGLGHRALPFVLVLPAVALALPCLGAGLQLDDYVVLGILSARAPLRDVYPNHLDVFNFFDGSAERTRRMLDLGVLPWWSAPDLQVAFWRPLAAVTHWLDATAWPERPVLMHAQSLCWFAVLVVAVGLMYRQLLTPAWAAGLAALLYVFDEAHALGVGWIAGRNALIGTMFGALALLAHDRWRRAGSRMGALLAPAALGLAVLATEGAVAIGGYLAAHAVCLDGGRWRRRLTGLVPAAVVLVGWQLAYAGLGYGAFGAAPGYVSPTREPGLFIRSLAVNAPVMLLAQWGGPTAESYIALAGGVALARWGAAMGALGILGLLLAPLLRRDPVARFWALGQVLALVPTGASSSIDRYLFFVGLGTMGLIARFVADWADNEAWRSPGWASRAAAAALAGLLLVLHGAVAPLRLARDSVRVAELGTATEAASDSLPGDPDVRSQLLVIPTAPTSLPISYAFFIRTVKRQPIPAGTRLLAAGAPVELYRPDAYTMAVRVLAPAERMFRAPEVPLTPGTRVHLPGTRIEVTAVDARGLPAAAVFRFDADLDSAGLRWMRWSHGPDGRPRFVALTPPAIGTRLRVD